MAEVEAASSLEEVQTGSSLKAKAPTWAEAEAALSSEATKAPTWAETKAMEKRSALLMRHSIAGLIGLVNRLDFRSLSRKRAMAVEKLRASISEFANFMEATSAETHNISDLTRQVDPLDVLSLLRKRAMAFDKIRASICEFVEASSHTETRAPDPSGMTEAGSSLEAKKAPTWEEAKAMQKRLDLMRQVIVSLTAAAKTTAAEATAADEKVNESLRALICRFVDLSSEMTPPDFSGMTEAERAAEAEILREETLAKARLLKDKGDPEALWLEKEASIVDFDPKQKGPYRNRCRFVYLPTFDFDEESPHVPMRFTDSLNMDKPVYVCGGVNILSVKIACSDVGYPIRVYGTVLVRDCIDQKCVYIFRRDRDHCQFISSKDKPLILTGPKRGLALLDDIYVEIDLKIKDDDGTDRQLSKGYLSIRGLVQRSREKCEVETESLSTRLSTVDVMYAVVPNAVEATIAVEVIEGHFDGKITAYTSSIRKSLVLYDNIVPGHGHRVVQLKRPVVSVFVKDALIIVAKTADGESVRGIRYPPKMKGREEDVITVGMTQLRLKVAWSIMDP